MTWNGENIQHAVAEIVRDSVGWPMRDTKERAHRCGVLTDERDARLIAELRIARDVIAMRVRVRDNQWNGCPLVPLEPILKYTVHCVGNVRFAGTSVKENDLVVSENQVKKRLLVVGKRRLP